MLSIQKIAAKSARIEKRGVKNTCVVAFERSICDRARHRLVIIHALRDVILNCRALVCMPHQVPRANDGVCQQHVRDRALENVVAWQC